MKTLAAGNLERMDKTTGAALASLRVGLHDPDKNVRAAFQSAITAIESAKDEPGMAEKVEKEKVTRAEIGRFLKALPGRAKE